MTKIARDFMIVGAFGLLMLPISALTAAPAYAQGVPAPLNLPPEGTAVAGPPKGISQIAAPPAGFNPLTASPAENRKYAIPPAPDAKAAPVAYAHWQRAVSGIGNPQNRVQTTLTQTNIFNGPAKMMGPSVRSGVANSVATTSSSNWSGDAVVNANDPFKVEAIVGEFTVPTAHQALGACTGGWDYSSLWPGIDGFNSNDVLQAGVEVDAFCNGSTTSSFYSAWIEWFPFAETRVSFPVNPGDLVFVEVWNTSSTTGFAFFYNVSTGQTAEYSLTAPSGTTLTGNSVEWIVERPGVNGGLATLTNYIDSAWPFGIAWNYTAGTPTYYWEGGTPAAGTLYLITMLDNSNNPISSAAVENIDFLWFTDYGSAY